MKNLTVTPPVKAMSSELLPEERCGYVYETTCKVTKKLYIGKHESNVFSFRYHGSGKHFLHAWKKYGPTKFVTRPIAWARTPEELNQIEKDVIAAYRCHYGQSALYNISEGGDGWPKGKKMPRGVGKKMSASRTGMRYSEEVRKKRSEAVKKSWENRSRSMSQEQKDKLRDSVSSARAQRFWTTKKIKGD